MAFASAASASIRARLAFRKASRFALASPPACQGPGTCGACCSACFCGGGGGGGTSPVPEPGFWRGMLSGGGGGLGGNG
eukprot:1081414-Alexandrium_andersonii.AAC.1